MTSDDAIAYYVECITATARQMPLADARQFLRGALLVGGEHDAVAPLRQAYRRLHEAEEQLELIAAGQLRLNLEAQVK